MKHTSSGGGATLRLTRFFWCEDSPTVSGAPLFFLEGVLIPTPTKGGTGGFPGGGEDAAGLMTGKDAVFDPPIDELPGTDGLRA
jgi:hypothetical protein